MKNLSLSLVLLGIIVLLSSCVGVKNKITDTFSGQGGVGEMTDLGNGKFDILAAGGFSADRADTFAKWDRTAELACKGGAYKIIERTWKSVNYPGLLGGTIQCTGDGGSSPEPTSYIPQASNQAIKIDSNASITCVQRRLSDLGYNPGVADGIMGKKTRKAITSYQKKNGLSVTGEIDNSILSRLKCTN